MCVAGGDCEKHGTVVNSTFELEVVPGGLEAMPLLYYEFGCLTNSQLGNSTRVILEPAIVW